jgi:hypothetical protein
MFQAGEQTEIERLMTFNQMRLDAIRDFNAQKIQLMIEAGATEQELESELFASKQRFTEQEQQLRLNSAQAQLGIAANMFQNLSTLGGSFGKKMFKAQKGFAIGQAIMDTFAGANRALSSLPFPANIAAMASVIAAGLANVKSIQSQQPTGGGAISAGGARQPAFGGGGMQSQQVPQRLEGQPEEAGQNVVINIQSLDTELDEGTVEKIITGINNKGAVRNLQINSEAVAPV